MCDADHTNEIFALLHDFSFTVIRASRHLRADSTSIATGHCSYSQGGLATFKTNSRKVIEANAHGIRI